MKDERINISYLKQRLASEKGLSEKEASTFIDALFDQIIAGLQEDGQVRISGLGTLRIQWNEPRKSVDVNTGNEITIKGYNKVTFTPESSVKERVNQPYSEIPTTIVSESSTPDNEEHFDPIQKLGEQAESIMDIVAVINGFERKPFSVERKDEIESKPIEEPLQNSVEEEPIQESIEEEPIQESVEEEPVVEPVQEAEETPEIKIEPIQEPTKEPEQEPIISISTPTATSTTAPITNQPSQNASQIIPPRINQPVDNNGGHDENSHRGLIITGIIISTLLLLMIVAYFVFPQQIDNWFADAISKIRSLKTTEQVEPQTSTDSVSTSDTLVVTPTIEVDQQEPVVEQTNTEPIVANEPEVVSSQEIPAPKPFAEEPSEDGPRYETIGRGMTLAAIARKYYHGQTDFWVYIYDANRDILKTPDGAELGMKLRIPYLDDGDPDVIIEAQRRAKEYKKIQ